LRWRKLKTGCEGFSFVAPSLSATNPITAANWFRFCTAAQLASVLVVARRDCGSAAQQLQAIITCPTVNFCLLANATEPFAMHQLSPGSASGHCVRASFHFRFISTMDVSATLFSVLPAGRPKARPWRTGLFDRRLDVDARPTRRPRGGCGGGSARPKSAIESAMRPAFGRPNRVRAGVSTSPITVERLKNWRYVRSWASIARRAITPAMQGTGVARGCAGPADVQSQICQQR
jgi:hypothetical protein